LSTRQLRTWFALSGLALFGAGGAALLAGCGGSSTDEPTVDAPAEEAPAEGEDAGEENL
jgi:hypothetical protein